MNEFAVIQTGGKQYRVAPGQKIKVEKLDAEVGKEVALDRVLLIHKAGETKIGMPYVAGASVGAKVLRNGRNRKVIVFRYHSKNRYRKTKGHRQNFTEVEIIKI